MPFFRSTATVSPPMPPKASTGPPSKDVAETMALLIELGNIPREHVAGVSSELRKILEEPSHAPYPEIIARASHPCVTEYLPQILKLLNQQETSGRTAMATMGEVEKKDFLELFNTQKTVYYTGIAELLGRGFTVALKPNLMFDANNNPIGVREKDRTRFPLCHSKLTGAGRKKTTKHNRKSKKTLRRRKVRRNMH